MQKTKDQVNLIVFGSTESGRSTTIGSFLFKLGQKNPKFLKDVTFQDQNKKEKAVDLTFPLKKLQFEMERNGDQKDKRIKFETDQNKCDIVDVIGHKNFMKNIIKGCYKANVALFITSFQINEREYPSQYFSINQQFLIAQTLGIKQLIIALNKIDVVGFSEDQYVQMKQQIENQLEEHNYQPETIHFIPVSAVEGDNLLEKSQNTFWYQGKTLIQALESVNVKPNLYEKPFRMFVSDAYKIGGVGIVPIGTVQTGFLKPGMIVNFCPSGLLSECIQFEMMHHPFNEALPNDNIGFSVKGIEVSEIKKGNVISDAQRDPARKAISFTALLALLEKPNPIEIGHVFQLQIHFTQVDCRIKKILYKIGNRTGNILEENPKQISKRDTAFIEIEPLQPLCIEEFNQYPSLGRFILTEEDETIAVGIVYKVDKVLIN